MPAHLRLFAPLFAAFALTLAVSLAILTARGIAISGESWRTMGLAFSLAAALAGGAWLSRNERALLAGLTAACFVALAPPLAVLSYAMTSLGAMRPLHDEAFAAIDAAMFFDWIATVAFINEWPLAIQALKAGYHGTIVGLIYAYCLLNVMNRSDRIAELTWLFFLTCVAANVISALFPAVGAYVLHQPAEAVRDAISADSGVWHLAHFEALRAGTFSIFEIRRTEGLVTFPSFHTAAALVIPIALRGLGPITALAWAFAAVVVISTIPIGGHYLIDVIAGAAMTFATYAALKRVRWTPGSAARAEPVPAG